MPDFGFTAAGSNKPEDAGQPANERVVPSEENNEETIKSSTAYQDKQEDLNSSYIMKRSVKIALINNHSLYRKMNDRELPKKRDYIGSSVRSSQILASNKGEVEAYFPNLVGLSSNNENFLTRVKQYLNNIQIHVDELGITFDTSFYFNKKRDYLAFKKKEEEIEETYNNANKQTIEERRKAVEFKINSLNSLESDLYKVGYPLNISDYIAYRHCLLYRDVAKDVNLINSNPFVRFYFIDENKEKERELKRRQEINNAKRNYITVIGDSNLFKSVYIQYCVNSKLPIIPSLAEEQIEKEIKLDKFSSEEPAKFNKIVNDKQLKVKSFIELLIARGDLIRSQWNQNITTADGVFVGANMKEAVAWANNPENEDVIKSLKDKLKYI